MACSTNKRRTNNMNDERVVMGGRHYRRDACSDTCRPRWNYSPPKYPHVPYPTITRGLDVQTQRSLSLLFLQLNTIKFRNKFLDVLGATFFFGTTKSGLKNKSSCANLEHQRSRKERVLQMYTWVYLYIYVLQYGNI